jgi:hypothetical protein
LTRFSTTRPARKTAPPPQTAGAAGTAEPAAPEEDAEPACVSEQPVVPCAGCLNGAASCGAACAAVDPKYTWATCPDPSSTDAGSCCSCQEGTAPTPDPTTTAPPATGASGGGSAGSAQSFNFAATHAAWGPAPVALALRRGGCRFARADNGEGGRWSWSQGQRALRLHWDGWGAEDLLPAADGRSWLNFRGLRLSVPNPGGGGGGGGGGSGGGGTSALPGWLRQLAPPAVPRADIALVMPAVPIIARQVQSRSRAGREPVESR